MKYVFTNLYAYEIHNDQGIIKKNTKQSLTQLMVIMEDGTLFKFT